jgi:hypothetical protein
MPAFAAAFLGTAVGLSALGAVVLCTLVVLYGFTPAGEDPPDRANRRLLLTRVGHAIAAFCFTATAILIAVVLVAPGRPPAPVAATIQAPDGRVPVLGQQLAGQEKRLLGQEARLAGQESRLAETETRLHELENQLRRREAELARAEAERAASVKASAPSPVKATVPSPVKATVPAPAKSAAPVPPKLGPASPARPFEEMTLREPSPPPAASPRAPDPPAPPPAPPSHTPTATPVVPPPAPVAAVPARSASPEDSRPAPAPEPSFNLSNKLKQDWREIQRGVSSAGDDFRDAVDNLKRHLLGH